MTSRPPNTPRFVSVPEVAKELGISRMTVYRMIKRNELPAFKFGSAVRIPSGAVWTYIENAKYSQKDQSA